MNLDHNPRSGTFCMTCAGLAVDASAKADAETYEDLHYCIHGKTYKLTSGDGDVQLDGNTVTSLYTAIFLVCVDSSGTITVVKSSEVLNATITNGGTIAWPEPTADTCPIGALVIKNASSSVFTGGTTEQDATDITTTYINFFTIPAEPYSA